MNRSLPQDTNFDTIGSRIKGGILTQERIGEVADESDLEEVYHTERHPLYVGCTRARDHLLLTSGDVPSEFPDDLQQW